MKKTKIALCITSVAVALCMSVSLAACTVVEEHVHTWDNGTTTATCTEGGSTTYTCTECGETVTVPASALGHDYAKDETASKDATCTADGETVYTCTRCGDSHKETVEALGHSYEAANTTATCEAGGVITYTCSRCEDTYTEKTEALGHSYEVTSTSATCTAKGKITYTCSRCGDSYEEETDALGHNYEVTSSTVTCTAAGTVTYTCSRCGDTHTDTVAEALGHDWVETNTATCEAAGQITYTCSRCGETDGSRSVEYVEALGHDYVEDVDSETATCTSAGTAVYTCSRCGDTYEEEVSALGHNYVFDVRNIPCSGTVTLTGACTRCGEEVSISTNGTGHHYELSYTTEATCTEDGVSVYECTRCTSNTYQHSYTVVDTEALGHDWEESSSETVDGITTTVYACTRCDATYSEKTDSEGNVVSEWDGSSIDTTGWQITDEDTGETTYKITTAAQLAGFAEYVNNSEDHDFSDCTVELAVDVDLNNYDWTPIGCLNSEGNFAGTFDGNGYTIYNLSVESSGYAGLFGKLEGTVKEVNIHNVKLENSNICSGAIAGYANESSDVIISDCHITGLVQISGTQYVGGLVGWSVRAGFENCSVEATGDSYITGTDEYVGGIVGSYVPHKTQSKSYDGVMTDITVSGLTITGTNEVGGILGSSGYSANKLSVNASDSEDGGCKIENCTITASNSSGKAYVGAIVGYVSNAMTISNLTIGDNVIVICYDADTYVYGGDENNEYFGAGYYGTIYSGEVTIDSDSCSGTVSINPSSSAEEDAA